MAKDVGKAVAQANGAKASAAAKNGASGSLSVGFKKQFTVREQGEIKTKRRELRARDWSLLAELLPCG